MDNLKEKALEISNRHAFTELSPEDSELGGNSDINGGLTTCENHLDMNFMALLKQGAHLD